MFRAHQQVVRVRRTTSSRTQAGYCRMLNVASRAASPVVPAFMRTASTIATSSQQLRSHATVVNVPTPSVVRQSLCFSCYQFYSLTDRRSQFPDDSFLQSSGVNYIDWKVFCWKMLSSFTGVFPQLCEISTVPKVRRQSTVFRYQGLFSVSVVLTNTLKITDHSPEVHTSPTDSQLGAHLPEKFP